METALHSRSSHSIVHAGSPLPTCGTTASYCTSIDSTTRRANQPVPPPLGLSDPASLTGNTTSSALVAETSTWLLGLALPSEQKISAQSKAFGPGPPLQPHPEPRLNVSIRKILFRNPDYAERLIRMVQGLPIEDRAILLDQGLDGTASLGDGGSAIRHHAGSGEASDEPPTSSSESNKRKDPPNQNQQDPSKAPNDSPGSGSGGGSASGQHQNKKSKESEFRYLCPYRRAYNVMNPQLKFRSCQPPGHIINRSGLKRHLFQVHVRTQSSQTSQVENPGLGAHLEPDYSMDKDMWEKRIVKIFDDARSNRFPRGSEAWLKNEKDCYQAIYKIILPNQPIPTSPFYEDSVDGHPLIEVARRMLEPVFDEKANRAIQNGQVTSIEDYRPSREEAMDMMTVAIATLLHTTPELSRQINTLLPSQADFGGFSPLTGDTRPATPATSSHGHVISQGPPQSMTTALQLTEMPHQTLIAGTSIDQQDLGVWPLTGNIHPEIPSMSLLAPSFNTAIPAHAHPARTVSRPQAYVRFEIEPPGFEITLKGWTASGSIGPQNWEVPVPASLVVETYEQRRVERPVNYGQLALCSNFDARAFGADSQMQGTGDGSFTLDGDLSELLDTSSNLVEGARSTSSDTTMRITTQNG
ncbi:hypothetical protein CDV36_006427 [Fusarium kuroshium]|uniref:Uncharacterized protein n=1 Tax=Fusarium kuroshium TaxID=2010991 RepID=A0A3M2S8P3_9HYPO|nr:hypothetical protein CDV36_006427 [Fusarium kuroshium]